MLEADGFLPWPGFLHEPGLVHFPLLLLLLCIWVSDSLSMSARLLTEVMENCWREEISGVKRFSRLPISSTDFSLLALMAEISRFTTDAMAAWRLLRANKLSSIIWASSFSFFCSLVRFTSLGFFLFV